MEAPKKKKYRTVTTCAALKDGAPSWRSTVAGVGRKRGKKEGEESRRMQFESNAISSKRLGCLTQGKC
jgi:hypothetical protein